MIPRTGLPQIIQGGMGAGVSGWRLARAVSTSGGLGVVSGTGLDQIMFRRLQDGDPGGNVRRALAALPLRDVAERVLARCFNPGGRGKGDAYGSTGFHTVDDSSWLQSLCIASNFVEVFLARDGHDNPVGINYLEKIQLPHLPSLYGAMLAGVDVVIVGAGIPLQIPPALSALSEHSPAIYEINVDGSAPEGVTATLTLDPRDFWAEGEEPPELHRPLFLPIVSSNLLVSVLLRQLPDQMDGFIVEMPSAGGHNAPPRGRPDLSDSGEPVYGPRDSIDLERIRDTGLPFWLAGSYGSHAGLQKALAESAAGVQVGTAFALCAESGLDPGVKERLLELAQAGSASVFTDPSASPTGFPFKVADLPGSLSSPECYKGRVRKCDLGFLRAAYWNDDVIGYRCPAEPENDYVAKGGRIEDTAGRKCLCNALLANIGLPQILAGGSCEQCLVTLGDDFHLVTEFVRKGEKSYTASDVIETILHGPSPKPEPSTSGQP